MASSSSTNLRSSSAPHSFSPYDRAATMPWTLRSKSKSNVRDEVVPSPPQTSHTHTAGIRRANKPNLRMLDTSTLPPPPMRQRDNETFLDDLTPGAEISRHTGNMDLRYNEDSTMRDSRDSHDLNLAQDPRHSLVENMLFSLDQLPSPFVGNPPNFPAPQAPAYDFEDDQEFLASTPRFAAPSTTSRQRGHTYSSSFSSDYDIRPSDSASHYNGHAISHTRRSHSSSNVPTSNLDRIDSIRAGPSMEADWRGRQVGSVPSTAHARGRSKKGSKGGSASGSLDFRYDQALNSGRMAKRSASFDQSIRDRMGHHIPPAPNSASMTAGRSQPQVPIFDSYPYDDTAPTPTVPAGPRRAPPEPFSPNPYASPTIPPHPPPSAPVPALSRKGSAKSAGGRKARMQKAETVDASKHYHEFVYGSHSRDIPPIPNNSTPNDDPSAPSPSVGTGRRNPHSNPPQPTKEKSGFFRRVFGGSSKPSNPPTQERFHSQNPSTATKASEFSLDPPPPMAGHNLITKSGHKPPERDTRKDQPRPPSQPVVQKKSSFFRRRKKSISEAPPPPPVPAPLQLQQEQLQKAADNAVNSPSISSLRQAMDPYLVRSATSDVFYDSREAQSFDANNSTRPTAFSPGYSPKPGSTVRALGPVATGIESRSAPPTAVPDTYTSDDMIGVETPKLKLKVNRHRESNSAKRISETFLADSSGTEERSATASAQSQRLEPVEATAESRRPQTSPVDTSFRHSLPNAKDDAYMSPRERRSEKNLTISNGSSPAITHQSNKSTPTRRIADAEISIVTPTKNLSEPTTAISTEPSNNDWIDPASSEEKLDGSVHLSLPLEGARASQHASADPSPATTLSNEAFQSATSLPLVTVDGDAAPKSAPAVVAPAEPTRPAPVPEDIPSTDDYLRADQIFKGEAEFTTKDRAAAWLGDATHKATMTRKAYMELFEWSGLNILAAMRDLCGHLILKGETQQVDRILDALSHRWCECNPNHGFKATDVVHTMCYSILLLNTDLHMADIESKMTRSQFVKNTLSTVRRVALDSIPDETDDTVRATAALGRPPIPWTEPNTPDVLSPADSEERHSLETKRSRNRLSFRPAARREDSDGWASDAQGDSCNVLVKAPYKGDMRGWEFQVEIVLKEFYNSIRDRRLPLHGSTDKDGVEPTPLQKEGSSNNLTVSSMLRRTPSVLSKAPSESASSFRSRDPNASQNFRSMAARWNPKARSRPRLYPNSTVGSSRTSLDDNSVWSPAGSSTWSKYSLGKTQTSMSVNSFGSQLGNSVTAGDYQQSIGFANALSQAIIREEGAGTGPNDDGLQPLPLLEDETLGLAGPPWAKEGLLKHKHHLESVDKKAKDRNWTEVFAVIEKGWVKLFSFDSHSSSSTALRLKSSHKHKPRPSGGSGGVVVGGGNWTENAETVGEFLLRQTIASALPPPGYSKARPHVWALSLPTGAVHLFQAGTADIVREFVTTANYWSARLSKEPLVGGVSNIEYGWSDSIVNSALISALPAPPQSSGSGMVTSPPPSSSGVRSPGHHRQNDSLASVGSLTRPSLQGSVRGSMDHSRPGAPQVRARLPGDKVIIHEWTPPTQSMMASNLMEVDQLRGLSEYVKNVEKELQEHQELRSAMETAYSPRHINATKSMNNWEKKSKYLLHEINKFLIYIQALNAAQTAKEKIYAERKEREDARSQRENSVQQDDPKDEAPVEAEVMSNNEGTPRASAIKPTEAVQVDS